MHPLIEKVRKTLLNHQMTQPGDGVVIGLSGGPDSMALLHCLLDLREEFGLNLVLGHLNHCARGEESELDARFVENVGRRHHLPVMTESIDVPSAAGEAQSSFQETARNIRLDYLEACMRQAGAHRIALGHTADDRVETVLINFLRGSGLLGMGGMHPVRIPFIRPLYDCTRAEILDFLEEGNIEFRVDATNDDTKYLRNRVRKELIPLLENSFNPDIRNNLLDASQIFQAENQWLDPQVEEEFARFVLPQGNEIEVQIPVEPFSLLPLALKRRLVRRCLKDVQGHLRKITFAHVEDILRLFENAVSGKRIDLPGQIQILRLYDRVAIKRIVETSSDILKGEADSRSPEFHSLLIPGETRTGSDGVTFQTAILAPEEVEVKTGGRHQAYFDLDRTGEAIRVRFFQPGDRFQPLGLEGTQKVKSLFIDRKVPREQRHRVPILTTEAGDIIWVYGNRTAHPYRVTVDTHRVLFIKGLP